jgi:hypothetical protein
LVPRGDGELSEELLNFFHPHGDPEHAAHVMDAVALMQAEGMGSYQELMRMPGSMRRRTLKFLEMKIQRNARNLSNLFGG